MPNKGELDAGFFGIIFKLGRRSSMSQSNKAKDPSAIKGFRGRPPRQ